MTSRLPSKGEGEPTYLVVGRLRRPHGVRGEILMEVITDFPERLQDSTLVYVGEDHQELRIRSRRAQGANLVLAFDGYNSPEEAGELRNKLVFVRAADRPALPEGEYYHHQLIGLRVISDEGQYLGTLKNILDYAANDVYVIQAEGGQEILLPAIDSVILDVDLDNGIIRVHLLPGLIVE